LARGAVAGYRHNFAFSAAGLSQSSRSGLAESMGAAIGQFRFIAPFSKSVAKAGVGERFAKLGHYELQIAFGARFDDFLKFRVDAN